MRAVGTGPSARAEAGRADESDGQRSASPSGRRPVSRTVGSLMPVVTTVVLLAGVRAVVGRRSDRPRVTAWWGVTTLTRGPPARVA